ncbi:potassium:proton antiporter [Pseudodesulfovibrio sp.]|uniref:potassium:proton antiporter n=1 Tax=unclassified Pseudodesulfovibrio TaxID=2661612 RepID=UPI003B00610C
MLKYLGMISWAGCLITLVYQAVTWIITASWPSVTLLDTAHRVGIDLTDFVTTLPVDILLKLAYVLLTTQLSLALWWLGLAFFLMAMAQRIILGK